MKDDIDARTRRGNGGGIANIALHDLHAGNRLFRAVQIEDPHREAALDQLTDQQLTKISSSSCY